MATYTYKCVKENCDEAGKGIDIDKPMSECTSIELCKACGQEMVRVYNSFSARTADGFKQ